MTHKTYQRASLMLEKAKGPKWKRELVSDHKFDFIHIETFRKTTCIITIRYFILLCSVIASTLVYCADLWSAGILLIYDQWSLSTQPRIPFYISKWIYVGCIIISFMLLSWEIRKTRYVMETRDISLAVTNPLAYRTYSLKSYSHFCLLQKIKSSTKWSDVVIFYVFYTLKTWKRVIVAQGPRQIIAGFTVYALLKSAWTAENGSFKFSADWNTYGQNWPQRVALFLMSFTCILWVLSALQIVIAVFLYIPILCHIQGNLKEYCCHKIDKRIDELLEKQRKKRLRDREKYSNSINSKKFKKPQNKNNLLRDESDILPALPTLPVINDVSHQTGKKTGAPWMYQQPQQQSFENYYDSQPMTSLELSYALQRNPKNYSPYDKAPNLSQDAVIYQPADAYTTQQDATNNDYNYVPQHYNSTIATPPSTPNTSYNKPHTYSVILDKATSYRDNNAILNSYQECNVDSHLENNQKDLNQETRKVSHAGYHREDIYKDAYGSNALQPYYNDRQSEDIKKSVIDPQTYANYL